MIDAIRRAILRFLKVPSEPHPPAGAPRSVRAFRAGKKFFYFKLIIWGGTQAATLAGIIFSFTMIDDFEDEARERKARQEAPARLAPEVPESPTVEQPEVITPAPQKTKEELRAERRKNRDSVKVSIREGITSWFSWMPVDAYFYITIIEYLGLLAFIAQLPVTFLIVRLDFEYRWYIVTDRSLRIRQGIFRLEEATMSFANIQQVEVIQGPIQRLLGIADVKVQSAGGGGGDEPGKDSMHRGVFHGVDNATEIRDFILSRLRQFREAGLGDPDDSHHGPGIPPPAGDALDAAREVLAEVRALRSSL